MSRSGYTDDEYDPQDLAMWRGQVASAMRGKRGQAFLRELVESLDAMPVKRLIAHELIRNGDVCAIGSVGVKRGVEMETLDVENYDRIASVFGIAHQLVQEIEYLNDEIARRTETPEARWQRMRDWAAAAIKGEPPCKS